MKTSRRSVLMSTLFGAGYVGLRALATGIPAAALLRGRRAFADVAPTCGNRAKAQYIIMHTSGNGDPINANVPGTYADTRITHPAAWATGTAMSLGGVQTKGALPWAQLPQNVLDRTTFWHIMTNTPVHPQEPDVLKLKGATTPDEMLPSLLAKQLAPCLGTVQTQPMSIGAVSPSEGLTFGGAALPIIPPLALKATLASQAGPLTNLQALRDDTLSRMSDIYRGHSTTAQAKYLDVFSPMPYHARSGHAADPAWIGRQVAWLGRHLGVKGRPGERTRIWPIVQLSDWGEPVTAAQVAEVIGQGARPPATGVTAFAWGPLSQDWDKVERLGRAYRSLRP